MAAVAIAAALSPLLWRGRSFRTSAVACCVGI